VESNSNRQIKVGIFICIGLVVILGSIFMLGADKAFFKSYVTLHAHFQEVQGLAEGSVISYSGITIGNIERIDIVPDQNLIDVVLSVDKKFMPRVTEGSLVEIRTQGALGDKFVFVIPGDPKGQPLADGAQIEVAKASDLLGIISSRGSEAEKVFDIINEMYRFTKSLNADGRTDKILVNLSAATLKLDKTADAAQKIAESFSGVKIKSSIDHLDSVLGKIDRGQGTLGALINDSTLHDQVKGMLGGSSRKNSMKSLIRTSIEKSDER
jgi:phospholipid/cholesterol/gamma-HCH transport system substrate-binding protein